MANQVVAGIVGAAIGVMMTTVIAMSVRPAKPAPCPACPPQPAPQPQPPQQQPAIVDAGVPDAALAEADLDGGPDLGDLTCTMDEVGCLLADRPPACCAMYGNRHVVPEPTSLTAAQVRDAVVRLRSRIVRCAEESDKHGTVRAQVKVAPDGKVASVTIRDAPDDALAQCVAAIMRSARFPSTDRGGSFLYPFVF
jgi:outer membrane biosynthesis protein TonB